MVFLKETSLHCTSGLHRIVIILCSIVVLTLKMLISVIQEFCLFIFSYSLSEWTLDCRGSDVAPCEYPLKTHMFPVTSSVTFVDIPVSTGPPKTRCILLALTMPVVRQ